MMETINAGGNGMDLGSLGEEEIDCWGKGGWGWGCGGFGGVVICGSGGTGVVAVAKDLHHSTISPHDKCLSSWGSGG